MGKEESKDVSSTEAVLMGALASGVNGPTWSMLKGVFVLLGVCLIAMLSLAFSSSDFVIVAHVTLLVFIGAVLFVLLSGFLEQTGFVSVEQQMKEIGLLNTSEVTEEVKKEN